MAFESPQAIFACVSASEMMANDWASLPVPAVVGTPIDGSIGRVALSWPRYSRIDPPLVSTKLMPFAQSSELPPPIATMESTPHAAAWIRPVSTMFVSGFAPKS